MKRARNSGGLFLLLAAAALPMTCKASLSKTSAAGHLTTNLSADESGQVPPRVYVAKVKNLLTGAPPTQDEIDQVTANPAALANLVQGWLVTPAGKAATLLFFENAFQQSYQPGTSAFGTMLGNNSELDLNTAEGSKMLPSQFATSFENTAWALAVDQKQPFNSLWTTRTFWATTAMLSVMLAEDGMQADKNGNSFSVYDTYYPSELSQMYIATGTPTGTMTADGGWFVTPVLTGNTTSVFGTTYNVTDKGTPSVGVNCRAAGDPLAKQLLAPNDGSNKYADALLKLMLGYAVPVVAPAADCYNPNQPACATGLTCLPTVAPWDLSYTTSGFNALYPYTQYVAFQEAQSQFLPTDNSDWRLVTTRDLQPGESPMRFWDLSTLRQASTTNTVPFVSQKVGPFTTPAFLANWSTNNNNQARSTANQMLIISIGASFDGTNTSALSSTASEAANTDTTLGSGESAADAAHASNAACQSCHVALDPLRKFYSKNMSYFWAQQQPSSTYTSAQPVFNFGGVQANGNTLADLGNILQNHPMLAQAWVQKACYWINSSPCSTDDPEFIRITADFQNGFQFPDMIAELFSSSMVTNAVDSYTEQDNGEVVSISRLDHLSKTLSVRLNVPNLATYNSSVQSITTSIPADGFTRGATEPFQPTQPGLFFRAAVENFCVQISGAIVDSTSITVVGPYSSSDPGFATQDMVHNLMGILPSDPREQGALAILNGHYTKAIATGATPTNALRSTFVVACSSPAVVSIGL